MDSIESENSLAPASFLSLSRTHSHSLTQIHAFSHTHTYNSRSYFVLHIKLNTFLS